MKLERDNKYIAAVSGGPDSMALLHKYRNKIICVCHVDYHKREDSFKDKQIVLDFCKKNHIKCEVLNVKPKDYKNAKNKNFQSFARTIRYKFFEKCAKKYNCFRLLVAHNLNDFLETAVMQQNRKSLNFFYGIKQKNQINNLSVYRPLIKEFKTDLRTYCIENNVSFAIDSTNSQDIYERNRVRKQLNKLSRTKLLQLYLSFDKRNKEKAKEEQKAKKVVARWKKSNLKTLRKNSIDSSVVYMYLKNHGIENITKDKIQLVIAFIKSPKGMGSLRLQEGIKLIKQNNKLQVVFEKTRR